MIKMMRSVALWNDLCGKRYKASVINELKKEDLRPLKKYRDS